MLHLIRDTAGIHSYRWEGDGDSPPPPPPPPPPFEIPPPPPFESAQVLYSKVVLKHNDSSKVATVAAKRYMQLFKNTLNFSKGVF